MMCCVTSVLYVCRYEIGNGLYIGWSSALLALCGGFLLLWACNLGTSENIMCVSIHMLWIQQTCVFHFPIICFSSFFFCRTLPSQPLTRAHKIGRSQSQSTCSQYEMNAYVWGRKSSSRWKFGWPILSGLPTQVQKPRVPERLAYEACNGNYLILLRSYSWLSASPDMCTDGTNHLVTQCLYQLRILMHRKWQLRSTDVWSCIWSFFMVALHFSSANF